MKKRIVYYLFVLVVSMACCTEKGSEQQVTERSALTKEISTKQVARPVTTGLQENLPMVEDGISADYNAFNRSSDYNYVSEISSIVCRDEETNVIYFANVAGDGYLYRIKDGEVALAVEMPVNWIYEYNGKVYFLVHSYNKYKLEAMQQGDIYCYTPKDGKVKLIYAAGAASLKVTEDGIYFHTEEKEAIPDGTLVRKTAYVLPHGGETPVQDEEGHIFEKWEAYSDMIQKLELPENRLAEATVFRDYYIYSSYDGGAHIGCVHLKSGEKKNYDFQDIFYEKVNAARYKDVEIEEYSTRVKLPSVEMSFGEFLVTEEKLLWATGRSTVYCIDMETGEWWYYEDPNEAGWLGDFVYTDGEEIYVTYYEKGRRDTEPYFAKLEFTQGDAVGSYEAVRLLEE